jgi:phytoene dehydrogenase-like protein
MSRVVVVGGGFGGTAVAARLAKLGHEVVLVERLPRLGGALRLIERDGFAWDAGPTSTALPAVLRDLFRKSGRPLERELDLVPVQPLREHRFADGTELSLPSGSRSAQLEAVGAALGAGPARAWVDYVHEHAETWDLLRRSFLERPYDPEHVDRRANALLRTRTSLHKVVTRRLRDRRLQAVALSRALVDGQDPRRLPAWAGMWAYVEQSFGTWTVPGGLGRLAGTLGKRLAERKVDVRLGTEVKDLRLEGGRVTGVTTGEDPLDADVVVCAMDPRRLPALRPYVPRSSPAIPPAVCHLGLEGDVPRLPHEVVVHGDGTLVVRTGGTAPEGGAAWTVLSRGSSSRDVVEALAGHGIDVRRQVRVRLERTPKEQVQELAGSEYGTLWRGRASTARMLRLGNLPVDGVYLAGAHATAGPQLPLVGLTSAVVAERVGRA